MDYYHRVCWGSLPFRHPGKQSLSRSSSFNRFAISFPCHFSTSISSFRLLCTAFLAHSLAFCFPTTSSSLVWPIGFGCCRSSFIPSLQHIFGRLSQEIAVLYGLLSLQTLVLFLMLDLVCIQMHRSLDLADLVFCF